MCASRCGRAFSIFARRFVTFRATCIEIFRFTEQIIVYRFVARTQVTNWQLNAYFFCVSRNVSFFVEAIFAQQTTGFGFLWQFGAIVVRMKQKRKNDFSLIENFSLSRLRPMTSSCLKRSTRWRLHNLRQFGCYNIKSKLRISKSALDFQPHVNRTKPNHEPTPYASDEAIAMDWPQAVRTQCAFIDASIEKLAA